MCPDTRQWQQGSQAAVKSKWLQEAWAYLTVEEASKLVTALDLRMDGDDERVSDSHCHIGAPSGPRPAIAIDQ
jgi:hypothetical protein